MMSNQAKPWSKDWIKDIDRRNVTLFPLQLANCARLEKNNAVYIFDEVGSGKTISAGLMALHYLYHNYYETHNSKAKVLVITTSQLADRGVEPGPFKQIWLNKLPFRGWLFERHIEIKVINYDYRNIQKVNGLQSWKVNSKKNNWDLVIIDEAHMFLNSDTARYRELTGKIKAGMPTPGGRISAEKVVFLTATPIKEGINDLQTYSQIARHMTHSLGRNTNHECYTCFDKAAHGDTSTILAPAAKQGLISPDDLICATFDPSLPFTRYFKDTVRELNPCAPNKLFPRRKLAEIWMCSRENRQEVVLGKINELYQQAPEKNRFVIFVRWVRENSIDPGCSANELEAYFIENGFVKWTEDCKAKSVEVVTGVNHKSLSNYRNPDPSCLPTVLIVNYQIGEQGVNLPGYNRVINYHIPASPASLEQRFGRIDRLDSKSEEINTYFPLLESHCDNSTINFYIAVSMYLKHQLPVLPSRNSILTEEILNVYEKYSEEMQKQANKIKNIREQWKSDAPWEKILKYIDELNSQNELVQNDLDQDECKVADFILSADRTIDTDEPNDTDELKSKINHLKKICSDRLKEILEASVSSERIKIAKEMMSRFPCGKSNDEIGNLIYYYTDRVWVDTPQEQIIRNLRAISPVGSDGCAGIIRNSPNYKEYIKELKDFI